MMPLLIALLAALLAIAVTYWSLVRPWHLRWGATDDELQRLLPGDEVSPPHPKLNATHSITIGAPAADVWPWVVQMGQNRGGFYSYTWLENLVGCHMRNASRIIPEWQDLKVGDGVWLHPKAPPLRVLAIEPGRSIVLEKTWAFVLRPIDEQRTRLIVRGRGDYSRDLGNAFLNFLLWRVVFEPAHFIMERKMLIGIKQRSEAYSRRAPEEICLREPLHRY
jgi:hypothetical protein